MDAATIDVQALSLSSPAVEQVDGAEAVALAREANKRLADAVRNHPTRATRGPALGLAQIETAMHVIRVILGGTFDRYSRLQILVGHMGEALPFKLPN